MIFAGRYERTGQVSCLINTVSGTLTKVFYMPKKIIVHVGFGKCGSASIQEGLLKYKEALAQNGYAAFTHDDFDGLRRAALGTYHDHHIPIERQYLDPSTKNLDITSIADDINQTLLATKNTPVLSSEYFLDINPARSQARINFLKNIVNGFDDVEIQVYFRKPDALIRSVYMQWYKPDFAVDFSDFIHHFDFMSSGDNSFYTANAKTIVDNIRNIIPIANIRITALETTKQKGGVFADFCHAYDLGAFADNAPSIEKNTSINADSFAVLYTARSHLGKDEMADMHRYLKKSNFGKQHDHYYLLSKSLRQNIYDAYADDLTSLEADYGSHLGNFLDEWKHDIENTPDNLGELKQDVYTAGWPLAQKHLADHANRRSILEKVKNIIKKAISA